MQDIMSVLKKLSNSTSQLCTQNLGEFIISARQSRHSSQRRHALLYDSHNSTRIATMNALLFISLISLLFFCCYTSADFIGIFFIFICSLKRCAALFACWANQIFTNSSSRRRERCAMTTNGGVNVTNSHWYHFLIKFTAADSADELN